MCEREREREMLNVTSSLKGGVRGVPTLMLVQLVHRPKLFFNVGPPKEDIFIGHLLSPVFHSSYTLQLQIS